MENNNSKENINIEEQKDTEVVTEEVIEVNEEDQQGEKVEEAYTGKSAKISTKYDFKTMKYFHVYNNVHRRKRNIQYLVLALISLALTGYIVYDSITKTTAKNEEITISMFFIPAIMVLFAIYIIYQAFTIEASLDRRLRTLFMKQKVSELFFEVREDKIIITPVLKPEDTFSYDWIQVTSIAEIPQYYFFYSGKSPMFIIEKNPNAIIEGSYETIEEIIKEQIAKKPYQRIDKEIIKKPITFVHPDFDINDVEFVESEVVEDETSEEVIDEVKTTEEKTENDSQN